MIAQQLAIDGFYVVEVVLSVGQQWCIDAVDEIVVGREGERAQSTSQQLDGQSFAESAFSRT